MNHEGEIDLAALAAISPERLAAMLAEAATMLPCMQRRLYFELYVQQGGNVVTATRDGSMNSVGKRRFSTQSRSVKRLGNWMQYEQSL